MNETEARDESVRVALDDVIRTLQPEPETQRVMRRGTRRRLARLFVSYGTVVVFVGGAIWAGALLRSERRPLVPASITFSSPEMPWSFEAPSDWDARTSTPPDPGGIWNVTRTTVANRPLPEDADAYEPNAAADASSAFGEDGVVVIVERRWTHASSLGGEPSGPGPFVEDSRSSGWTFRQRTRCDGTICFHVTEWLGPAASDPDRASAAKVAKSVRLADVERWTETDGERITLHDEDDRFTVTYPADWLVADKRINDWVCSPFEILALATYPLRPGGEAVTDGQLPSNAVEDLGPNDILIWVNDSGNACGGTREAGSGAGFPERPERFGPLNVCGDFDRLCETEGQDQVPGIRGWWMAFEEAGRGFYVFVGMGEQAFQEPTSAQRAWDVLDSLRFLPR